MSPSTSAPSPQIGLGDLERNVEAVIARIAPDAAADGLDRVGNLLGGAGFGALHQHLGHQAGQAARRPRLGEQTAAENSDHRDKRQPRIFAHQQTQAIREFELLDLADGTGGRLGGLAASVPRGLKETTVRFSSTRYCAATR